LIYKEDIAKIVAERRQKACPGITIETVLLVYDSLLSRIEEIVEDDQSDIMGISLRNIGTLKFDYSLSLSKVSDREIQGKHVNATISRLNMLKEYLKKRDTSKKKPVNYKKGLLYQFYKKLTKKRLLKAHNNFYKAWMKLSDYHMKSHEF
jgi:hypothetical protein